MKMSKSLGEYPGDLVRLACGRCDRRGQYRKAGLLEKYGGDIGLPELCCSPTSRRRANRTAAAGRIGGYPLIRP